MDFYLAKKGKKSIKDRKSSNKKPEQTEQKSGLLMNKLVKGIM
jgi:hypothetical protein